MLELAGKMKLLMLGIISLDGIKGHADALCYSTLSRKQAKGLAVDHQGTGAGPKARSTLADEGSRIMRLVCRFERCHAAQAAVNTDRLGTQSMLIRLPAPRPFGKTVGTQRRGALLV